MRSIACQSPSLCSGPSPTSRWSIGLKCSLTYSTSTLRSDSLVLVFVATWSPGLGWPGVGTRTESCADPGGGQLEALRASWLDEDPVQACFRAAATSDRPFRFTLPAEFLVRRREELEVLV